MARERLLKNLGATTFASLLVPKAGQVKRFNSLPGELGGGLPQFRAVPQGRGVACLHPPGRIPC